MVLRGVADLYLNEDTHPVIRALGVSHTACNMSFDEIFDLTAGVYFTFMIRYV